MIRRIGECPDCGTEFDPESFRVSCGPYPYMSYLCRKCAAENPDVEIIEMDINQINEATNRGWHGRRKKVVK